MDEFDKWNELKKKLCNNKVLKFKERDIWFLHMGKNIGYEQNGKGEEFLRPVLVLRKFSNRYFLGVPLTSKEKKGSYFFNFYHKGKLQTALLNQTKVFDIKRVKYSKGLIGEDTFNKLVEAYKNLITPQKEGSGPLGQNCKNIISQKNRNSKYIWFDLITPKSVLFFNPIIQELKKRDKNILITAREGQDYKEVVDLLNLYNLEFINRGTFGGGDLKDKLHASIHRQKELMEFISRYDIEKLVCLSSVDAVRVAFGLGLPVCNFYDIPLSDYKTNFKRALPQARLTIPLSTKMFKPFVVPDEVILRFGLEKDQIVEYNFIDPLIWLMDFKFNEKYVKEFYEKFGIDRRKFTILIREEEYKASYVNKKYPFLYEMLSIIHKKFDANIIIIPRYESDYLKREFPFAYIIDEKIVLQHLLKDVDLFIGGGGTINTEACFLGTPTISTRSFISHYDKWQIDNGLMVWTNNKNELMKYVKMSKEHQLEPKIGIIKNMKVNLKKIVQEIIS
jgi:hypothetical protein